MANRNPPSRTCLLAAICALPCLPAFSQVPVLGNYPIPHGLREVVSIGPLHYDSVLHLPEQVLVVNLLPNIRSGESGDQTGIDLAVNPAAPDDLAAIWWPMLPSFGPPDSPRYSSHDPRPLCNSRDGGYSWTENHILAAHEVSMSEPGYYRVANAEFAEAGGYFYAGLRDYAYEGQGYLLRSANPFGSDEAGPINSSIGTGLPHLAVTTVSAAEGNRDRLLVGYPNLPPRAIFGDPDWDGRIASMAHSPNARTASTELGFTRRLIQPARERYAWAGGRQVRVATHRNGTAYALFSAHLRRLDLVDGYGLGDVMVFRNDATSAEGPTFSALIDPSDGLPGRVIARDRGLYRVLGSLDPMGPPYQSDIDIVVDPGNADRVYAAWTDSDAVSISTLHVSRSDNGGADWREILTLADAINPALAVTAGGTVGLLHQQESGAADARRVQTVLRRSRPERPTDWSALVISAVAEHPSIRNYLMTYYAIDLEAVGETFYGGFFASNVPDLSNFPRGVRYQRNADFTTHRLLDVDGTTEVAPSLDPFFFKVTPGGSIPNLCSLPGAIVPCLDGTYYDFGRIVFEVDTLPFFAVDSLPRNCLATLSCPGCRKTTLCPPYHHIYLEGLDPAEWDVGLYDGAGQSVKRRITPVPGGIAVSFRPEKSRFREKDIGDYRLGFATKGQIAKRKFAVKTRLEVSDYPKPGQKAAR